MTPLRIERSASLAATLIAAILLLATAAAAIADEPTVLRGHVLLPDGKPAEGAELYWMHLNVPEPKTPDDVSYAKRAVTDEAGRFELAFEEGDAPLGPMRPLLAYKRGYGVEWTTVGPGEVPPEITLKLPEDHPIRGRVIDTEGRAVVGANVVASHISAASMGNLDEYLAAWKSKPQQARRTLERQFLFLHAVGPALATVTDRDGRFELVGVGAERLALVHISGPGVVKEEFNVVNREHFDPAPYNQAAAANGRPRMRMLGNLTELSGPVIEHVAESELLVRGTVFTGPGRKPIAGANVSSHGRGNYNITSTQTDEAGRFELRGLRRSQNPRLQVRVPRGDKFLFRAVELEVPLGQTVINVDVEMKEGVVVEGRVFDKATGRGVTSSIQFVPLPDNTFAKDPAYNSFLSRVRFAPTPTDADGHFRILTMPGPGVLMARVQGGNPFAGGAKPIPYRQAAFSEEDGKRVTIVVDGEDRRFVTADNAPGRLTDQQAAKVVDLLPGEQGATYDLPLDPGKTATIAIEDETGQPVTDAIVSGVADAAPSALKIAEATCTIYGLGPDRPRQVWILHPERHLAASVMLTGDEQGPVTVRLGAAASIVGRALGPDGEPLADAILQIYYPHRSAQELIGFVNRDKAS
ncbi:MAG: hypothetical protein ACREHD_00640, partial [Pirellulales bacterium]